MGSPLERRDLLKLTGGTLLTGSLAGCTGGQYSTDPKPPTEWRMARRDASHTAASPRTGYPVASLHTAWDTTSHSTESAANTTNLTPGMPAAVGTTVFVPGLDGSVTAVSLDTGQQLWRRKLDGSPVATTPAVLADRVYVGTQAGRVFAVNRSTGSVEWQFPHGTTTSETTQYGRGTQTTTASHTDSPTIDGSFTTGATVTSHGVYIQSDHPHRVYSLTPHTGEKRWEAEIGDYAAVAPVTVAGINIYVPVRYGFLTFQEQRHRETKIGLGWKLLLPTASTPVYHKGHIYLVTAQNTLVCLDGTTAGAYVQRGGDEQTVSNATVANEPAINPSRRIQWQLNNSNLAFVGNPALSGSNLFCTLADGGLASVDITTGKVNGLAIGTNITTSPTASGGLVYAGSDDGTLYILDGLTASVITTVETGIKFQSDVIVTRDTLLTNTVSQPPATLTPANTTDTTTAHQAQTETRGDPAATRERLVAFTGEADASALSPAIEGKLNVAQQIDANSERLNDQQLADTATARLETALSNGDISYSTARGAVDRLYWAERVTERLTAILSDRGTITATKQYAHQNRQPNSDSTNNSSVTGHDGTVLSTPATQKYLAKDTARAILKAGLDILLELLGIGLGKALRGTTSAARSSGTSAGLLDEAYKSMGDRIALKNMTGGHPQLGYAFREFAELTLDLILISRYGSKEAAEHYVRELAEKGVIDEKMMNDLLDLINNHVNGVRNTALKKGSQETSKYLSKDDSKGFLAGLASYFIKQTAPLVQAAAEVGVPDEYEGHLPNMPSAAAAAPASAGIVGTTHAWENKTIQNGLESLTAKEKYSRIKRYDQLPGSRQNAADAQSHFINQLEEKTLTIYDTLDTLDFKFEATGKQYANAADNIFTIDEEFKYTQEGSLIDTAQDTKNKAYWNFMKGVRTASKPIMDPISNLSKAGFGMSSVWFLMHYHNRAANQIIKGKYDDGLI